MLMIDEPDLTIAEFRWRPGLETALASLTEMGFAVTELRSSTQEPCFVVSSGKKSQHAADLGEHGHHAGYVLVKGRLKAKLAFCPIVPQPPVRRRRHAALYAARIQLAHLG